MSQVEEGESRLKNGRMLRACRGQAVDRIPVWIMRQAGRYLPEFRDLRSKHDFFTLCRTPALACEVTLQPLKRFDLDAAIIFSDILIVPQALGMEVEMRAGVGPVFPNPLSTEDELERLEEVCQTSIEQRLDYLFEAIRVTQRELDGLVPLIGFAGAPWTLMSYMIEGGGSKTLAKAKRWLYERPELSERLLRLLTKCVVTCLLGQARAGAQILQVFESHAEFLNAELFRTFCLPYLKEIRSCVQREFPHIPMVLFAKGGHYALQVLSQESGYDVLGVDWTISPETAIKSVFGEGSVGSVKALQGNLDPCALYSNFTRGRCAAYVRFKALLLVFSCDEMHSVAEERYNTRRLKPIPSRSNSKRVAFSVPGDKVSVAAKICSKPVHSSNGMKSAVERKESDQRLRRRAGSVQPVVLDRCGKKRVSLWKTANSNVEKSAQEFNPDFSFSEPTLNSIKKIVEKLDTLRVEANDQEKNIVQCSSVQKEALKQATRSILKFETEAKLFKEVIPSVVDLGAKTQKAVSAKESSWQKKMERVRSKLTLDPRDPEIAPSDFRDLTWHREVDPKLELKRVSISNSAKSSIDTKFNMDSVIQRETFSNTDSDLSDYPSKTYSPAAQTHRYSYPFSLPDWWNPSDEECRRAFENEARLFCLSY
ncbi:unnamed protein product [Cyprideis torosa]|uniref:Uroporphyrinogen decarboxylase n=1 Tax=Cyprideis torosa TaxID=163714 RepID=A0A7R8W426_9CRUS|nr:unnamed protein product [Cyprideis torosa]CAG0881477.1 unnamed protein product [Cyprideis torosa]